MLIYTLLQIPVMIFGLFFSMFPVVSSLPFGIDTYLVTGFSNFLYVANQIPPLLLMYNAFLWVIAWKISLQFFKMLPIIGRLLNK